MGDQLIKPLKPLLTHAVSCSLGSTLRCFLFLLAIYACACPSGSALGDEAQGGAFTLTASIASELFPGHQGLQVARQEGGTPVWRVTQDGSLLGYAVSTFEISKSVGYSGQPIDVIIGISPQAVITGAKLIHHNEPILTLGISNEDIARYVKGFAGYDLKQEKVEAFKDSKSLPPIIARATVTTGVIRDAILRTGRTSALSLGLLTVQGAALDRLVFKKQSWDDLAKEGAIAHTVVEFTEAARLFGPIENPLSSGPGVFIDLWTGLLDPPSIGENILGKQTFDHVMGALGSGDSAVFVASSGLHSHRGTGYVTSGIFDRIELIQGSRTIKLKKDDYIRIDKLALSDAPQLNEMSVFRVSPASGFKASEPFRLEISAARDRTDGTPATIRIALNYTLPNHYILPAQGSGGPAEDPLWTSAWKRKPVTIAITCLMMVLVAAALFAQEWFVRRPKLWFWSRASFLTFNLLFLGWYANGQLSVVQVLAFFHSLLNGFHWETFLIEPVIFVLWSFVALGLLFWGRGVYCGWLCPFGALQELLNEGAKRLGVRQIEVPFAVQERLWALKYTLFVFILGLSFYSMQYALVLAEVEPFKTAISMRFMRAWPFLLFSGALLVAGLFVERFYCRYLCPLGAALAIPAKIKLFDWLHRRPQCGRECRLCETQCTVGAIDTLGHINPNECVLCLRCQVIMNDHTQCVVLKRREARFSGISSALEPQRNKRIARPGEDSL